jgi:DNA-binding MarR family transcriptional regulator
VHALFFAMKRAHHATLRVSRELLDHSGLTPARYDMMHALCQTRYGMLQRELGRMLGVSRATVSRMLRALETLRLVVRARAPNDRRQLWVRVTSQGAAVFRRAEREAVDSGAASLAIEAALAPVSLAGFVDMEVLDGLLDRVRQAFRDTGSLVYLWHPDD